MREEHLQLIEELIDYATHDNRDPEDVGDVASRARKMLVELRSDYEKGGV